MDVTVFDSADLCKRWGCAPNTIRKMEAEGKLHRLPGLPGVKFSAAEVYQLESIGPVAKGLIGSIPLTPVIQIISHMRKAIYEKSIIRKILFSVSLPMLLVSLERMTIAEQKHTIFTIK